MSIMNGIYANSYVPIKTAWWCPSLCSKEQYRISQQLRVDSYEFLKELKQIWVQKLKSSFSEWFVM